MKKGNLVRTKVESLATPVGTLGLVVKTTNNKGMALEGVTTVMVDLVIGGTTRRRRYLPRDLEIVS
jgi:hypothetical protein